MIKLEHTAASERLQTKWGICSCYTQSALLSPLLIKMFLEGLKYYEQIFAWLAEQIARNIRY